ncbi:hypothetical protein MBANPS3_012194 [Mucor bainieri]
MAKARVNHRVCRGVKRFMIYHILEASKSLVDKHHAALGVERSDLHRVGYLFTHDLVIQKKPLDFDPLSGDDQLVETFPGLLFTLLQDKNMDPLNLRNYPDRDVQELYTTWIPSDNSRSITWMESKVFSEINFAGIIAPFLTLFYSYTDEYHDETELYVFEQDAEEDYLM